MNSLPRLRVGLVPAATAIHTTQLTAWKGPSFDPEKLTTESGRQERFDLATRCYRIAHDAIRWMRAVAGT